MQTGVFVGNDPAALSQYGDWSGDRTANNLAYLNNRSWSDFDDSIAYEQNLWAGSPSSNIWSVPLTVNGTSLGDVASGSFNQNFEMAANALASSKPSADGNIYIRLGWEFNGNWMPWSAAGNEKDFIAAFQDVANIFRSTSSKFKIVWDVNEGGGNIDPSTAYPGDNYVDVVGMDSYYNTQWDSPDPSTAFNYKENEKYGFQWQQDFAGAHGKKTAFSEWGIESNNSATYVNDMFAWMQTHNMIFENYWNSDADYSGKLSQGQYAEAGVAYQKNIALISQKHDSATSIASPNLLNDEAAQQVSSTQPVATNDSSTSTAIILPGNQGVPAPTSSQPATSVIAIMPAVTSGASTSASDSTTHPQSVTAGNQLISLDVNTPSNITTGTPNVAPTSVRQATSPLVANDSDQNVPLSPDSNFTPTHASVNIVTYIDGTSIVDIQGPNQELVSDYRDTFLNHHQSNNIFTFNGGYGHDLIRGFIVGGENHDTLSFSSESFDGIFDVLHNTSSSGHGVVIFDPSSGDTVRLAGINKAQLMNNRNDFMFHD